VTVIDNVTVIPMEGPRALANQTVVIRDGRIAALLPTGTGPIPSDPIRVDGGGKFLFPGLTDAHVHLAANPAAWLPLFLAHGVTTVFVLQGGPDHLALRSRVASGATPGPTIYTSGPYTNQPGIMTAADAERAVAEQKAAGYDFIKIHGNLTAEAYAALIAAGKTRRLTVIGHAPRNLSFDSVIAARQPMVAHAEELIYTRFRELDTSAVSEVAARTAAAGIWVTPTLTTFSGIATQWGRPASVDSALALPEGVSLPAPLQQFWRGSNPYTGRTQGAEWAIRAFRFQQPMVRMLDRAGVPLLAGTDTPLPVMLPGHSLHDEILELERAGVSRLGALAAATVNPGRFIAAFVDTTTRFGTIAVGSRADFLLVDRNPLDDPTTLIHPWGVMAQGRWYDRAALDRMVEAASKATVEVAAEPTIRLTDAERRAFAGRFRSESPARSATVVDRDGKLFVEVPGQPVIELVAVGPFRFIAVGSIRRIEIGFDETRGTMKVAIDGTPYADFRRVP
jgi:imidazolonepropionase-like amidohydrolase